MKTKTKKGKQNIKSTQARILRLEAPIRKICLYFLKRWWWWWQDIVFIHFFLGLEQSQQYYYFLVISLCSQCFSTRYFPSHSQHNNILNYKENRPKPLKTIYNFTPYPKSVSSLNISHNNLRFSLCASNLLYVFF